MTLLVGILCRDGAVVAADRQITHGALGNQTVGQPGTKVSIINGNCLFASSGPVGMGQMLQGVVDGNSGRFKNKAYTEMAPVLQGLFRKHLDPAFETAQKAAKVVGANIAAQDVLCSCVLAARFKDGLKLVDISPQGGFEAATYDGVPFFCQGSGKANADPILRFLWNVFWNDNQPSLQECVLAAYWTIKIVIDLKTHGVGFEPDVFTLDIKSGKTVAKELTKAELAEHSEFIGATELAMRNVRAQIQSEGDGDSESDGPPTLSTENQ